MYVLCNILVLVGCSEISNSFVICKGDHSHQIYVIYIFLYAIHVQCTVKALPVDVLPLFIMSLNIFYYTFKYINIQIWNCYIYCYIYHVKLTLYDWNFAHVPQFYYLFIYFFLPFLPEKTVISKIFTSRFAIRRIHLVYKIRSTEIHLILLPLSSTHSCWFKKIFWRILCWIHSIYLKYVINGNGITYFCLDGEK